MTDDLMSVYFAPDLIRINGKPCKIVARTNLDKANKAWDYERKKSFWNPAIPLLVVEIS